MSDAWLGTLQREEMVPLLREDRWAEGLESGLAVVDAQLRLKADPVMVGAPPTWSQEILSSFSAVSGRYRLLFVLMSAWIFTAFVVHRIQRRFFLTAEEREELANMPPGTSAQERWARRREILRHSERYQTGHSRSSSSSSTPAPRSRGGRSGGGGAGSSF